VTPKATQSQGKTKNGAKKSYSAKIDQTTIGSEATPHHPVTFNATPIVITEPSKIQENPDTATCSQHATINATPTVGITKLITLPKMADSPKISTWSLQESQAVRGLVPDAPASSDVRVRNVEPYCVVLPTRHHRYY